MLTCYQGLSIQKKVAQARMMAGSHDSYDAMNSVIHSKPMADGQLFTFIDGIIVHYLSNTFDLLCEKL